MPHPPHSSQEDPNILHRVLYLLELNNYKDYYLEGHEESQ